MDLTKRREEIKHRYNALSLLCEKFLEGIYPNRRAIPLYSEIYDEVSGVLLDLYDIDDIDKVDIIDEYDAICTFKDYINKYEQLSNVFRIIIKKIYT